MTLCPHEAQLTPYLLGDLTPPEAEAVRLHLESCAACRAEAAELAPLLKTLRESLTADADSAATLSPLRLARVLATPPSKTPADRAARPRRRLPPALVPWLGLAATLFVVLGIVVPTFLRQDRAIICKLSAQDAVDPSATPSPPPAKLAASPVPSSNRATGQGVGSGFTLSGKPQNKLRTDDLGENGDKFARTYVSGGLGLVPDESAPTDDAMLGDGRQLEENAPASGAPQGGVVDGVVFGYIPAAPSSAAPAAAPEPLLAPAVTTSPVKPSRPASRALATAEKPVDEATREHNRLMAERKAAELADRAHELRTEVAVTREEHQDLRRQLQILESKHAALDAPTGTARPVAPSEPLPERPLPPATAEAIPELERELARAKHEFHEEYQKRASIERRYVDLLGSPSSPANEPAAVGGDLHYATEKADGKGQKDADGDVEGNLRRAEIESVTFIKSPIVLRGIHGDRSGGTGGRAAQAANSAPAEGGDVKVEIVWEEQAGEKAKVSRDALRRDAGLAEQKRTDLPLSEVQRLREQLSKIVIPEVHFRGANLTDVVAFLNDAAREYGTADETGAKPVPSIGLLKASDDDAPRAGQALAWPDNLSISFQARYVPLSDVLDTVSTYAGTEIVVVDGALQLRPARSSEGDPTPPPPPAPPPVFNPVVETASQPLSTFAIDVDTAAYTLARQSLLNGRLPDPGAIRTEEVVNAFDYGDRAPEEATFRIFAEGAPAPFAPGRHLVRLGVKGRRLGREEQRPAVLTFLVDASGSMAQPDRLGFVRLALEELSRQLGPNDQFQLLAFNETTRVVLDPTPAARADELLAAFDRIQPTGPTHLERGMEVAYAQAAAAFQPGAENRVILLSDGVANLGTAEAADILAKIDAARRQGLTLSVFGVGRGAYNDALLEQLANRGDGTYRFLDSPEEVRRAFVDDLAATLYNIASDVKIQVEWNPAAVVRYRQLGYENRALTAEQFRDDRVDAGEVGSGQAVTALYEVERTAEADRRRLAADALGVVRVRYRPAGGGPVEEITRAIQPGDLAPSLAAARPQFRVAAGAAAFAERLRQSPHAAAVRFEAVAELLRPASLALSLDTRIAELVRLVEAAEALTR